MEYLLEGLAAEAQRQGQQTRYKAYLTALRSVQKYPLPLKSGQEAMMLEGVGPGIATKLDQLLPRLHKEIDKQRTVTAKTSRTTGHKRVREDDQRAGVDENASENARNAGQSSTAPARTGERADEPANKRQRSRAYTPRLRSIPYAVVMALGQIPAGEPMDRATLFTTAAPFCDTPVAAGDKEDGAWKTAISTLVKKGFVQRHPLRSTPHYSLTTEGDELAERLSRANGSSNSKEGSASTHSTAARSTIAVVPRETASVATTRAPASTTKQTKGRHASNEDSCDLYDDADSGYDDVSDLRPTTTKKKRAETKRQRQQLPSEGDKENRDNFADTQVGWESSGRPKPRDKPPVRLTIDLCASPPASPVNCVPGSPSYHGLDHSLLDPHHLHFPHSRLPSPQYLHPSHNHSPVSPALTAPYKPSFRFGYVTEDEQWCAYRWEAAEKLHEGERYYRISTTQDPTLWDSHYRLLVSPFRKSSKTLHRAWLREDDAPAYVQTPFTDLAPVAAGNNNKATAESESDRDDGLRSVGSRKPTKGLARRNLTTELDDASSTESVHKTKTTAAGLKEREHSVAPQHQIARAKETTKRKGKEIESEDDDDDDESEVESARARLRTRQASRRSTAHQRQVLPRDAYEVVMLVDTREIAGKGNGKGGKSRKTIFQEMVKRGIACEERSLALGDFMWVARDKKRGTEYVMDVIVERKKVDDLWSSIKDGRYYEQKFRLARSGVERVVYIVEGTLQASGNPHKTWNQLPVDTLESALVSTQVGNDFVVQRCATLRDTISFLKTLTRQLTARTDSITLRDDDEGDDDEEEEEEDNEQQDTITHDRALWEIGRWSEKVSKSGNLTITDVFAKQLLQINGVSPAKAKAITDRYATPWKLAQAYGRCADEAERMGLLAQLTAAGRKLGPALSKRVHEVMWAAI